MPNTEHAQQTNERDTSTCLEKLNQHFRNEMFSEVARVAGVPEEPDASWARYVFSSEFAEHRHSKGMYNGQIKSAISILFTVMTEEERRAVMTGHYDLGNGLPIPDKLRHYKALNRFLGYSDEKNGLTPLRRWLDQIISLSFSNHLKVYPDIALKVMALLHRYKTGRDGSLAIPHLSQLLRLPGQKRPSLEINEWDASKDGRKISCVIDELIVHLESELDQECRNAVDRMVKELTLGMGWATNTISASVKRRAKGQIETGCALFENVLQEIAKIKPKDDYVQETAPRLDLDLLIYLHRLQIEHRNVAHAEMTTMLSGQTVPVVNILDPLTDFDKIVTTSQIQQVKTPNYLTESEARDFINYWKIEIKRLMELAFRKEITDKEFMKACDLASAFTGDLTVFIKSESKTLGIVASMCVAHADAIKPFRYTPFWHGQSTQAGTAFYPANKGGTVSREDMPEGRIVFWQECQEWIGASLIGKTDYWDLDRRLHDSISDIISASLSTHDVMFIHSVFNVIKDYANAQVALEN